MSPIFYIKEGYLAFGERSILEDVELYVYQKDKICLVGENGSGKSSLLKLIHGEYEIDKGELFKKPASTIGYLKQDINLDNNNCKIIDIILDKLKNNEEKYKAEIILAQLDLDGEMLISHCSGGQIRRAILAATLVTEPDILLLDEPTNHLDIKSIEWLEQYLKNYDGAVICISHDRTFQENFTNKIWWIDRAILRKSNKGFKYYDEWRDEIIKIEEITLLKMENKLLEERKWLSTGVTARRKRNQNRLQRLYQLREEIKAHENKLQQAKKQYIAKLSNETRKSQFIIKLENISIAYKDKEILSNFDLMVKKGEKIGIIGPNASGKSSLVKVIVKEIEPTNGSVIHGVGLNISYSDQNRTELNPEYSIMQTLCENGGDQVFVMNRYMHVAAYLKQFMFDPKMLTHSVSTLSGGQANRLLLAKTLLKPSNLLVLDEPTNDLDMDTLEMLLEILSDYQGTIIVVSHDRDFLERLVTRTLIFDEDRKQIVNFVGGYLDYTKSRTKPKANNFKNTINQKYKKENNSKLSYKYQRLLETLPLEIEKLEEEIKLKEEILNNYEIYEKSAKEAAKIGEEIIIAKQELESKIEEWFNISEQQNCN